MEEKMVIMVLKVDLECSRCYKKVKKILSKFPQIRDQVYNEKQNSVTIKVVCCKPEKIRDKICCKGGESIKSIEIKEPEKPKAEPEKKKEPEKQKAAEPEKKKDPEKQKAAEPEKKKEPEKQKTAEPEKKKEPEKQKAAEPEKKKETEKKKEPEKEAVKMPPPVQGYPPTAYPFGFCCGSCYQGHGGGPCYNGCGMPAPPSCYGGRPIYDSYGGGRGYYVSHCDYFNQENPTGCIVM